MTTEMADTSPVNPVPEATTDLDLAAALHEAAHRLSDPKRPESSSDSAGEQAAVVIRHFLTALETGDLDPRS